MPIRSKHPTASRYSFLHRLRCCIVILLLGGCGIVVVSAQDETTYQFEFTDTPLPTVFSQLEKEYSLTFAYDPVLAADYRITCRVSEQDLQAALDTLLIYTPFRCEIGQRGFVLITYDSTKPVPLPDEPVELCGRVLDALAGDPLPFASVQHLRLGSGSTSGEDGRFRFRSRGLTGDSIEVRYLGYLPRRFPIDYFTGDQCPAVVLRPDIQEMGSVVVTGQVISLLQTAENGNGIKFTPRHIASLPGWGEPDVLRSLQLLPGIQAADESASAISVRGGSTDQNLVLWDGIPVYHTGHLFGMFSAFNPHVVEHVDVYRSGFGANFGGRVSSVIDITGHPEMTDSARYGVGLNLLSLHGYVQVPMFKKRSSLLVGFRRSVADALETDIYKKLFQQISGNGKIEEHDDFLEAASFKEFTTFPQFQFGDFNIKYLFNFSEKSRGIFSIYSAEDKLDYTVTSNTDYFLRTRDVLQQSNGGYSLTWEHEWSDRMQSHFTMIGGEYKNNYQVSYSLDSTVVFNERNAFFTGVNDFTLRLNNRYRIDERQSLGFGYQATNQTAPIRLVREVKDGETTMESQTQKGEINTLFADYDWNPSRKLDIDLGLRINHFKTYDARFFEPRISIDWRPLSPSLHFKAGAGVYQQFVNQIVQNNELGLGERLWVIADSAEFPVVQSWQASLGLLFSRPRTLIELELYRKRIDGLTTYNIRFRNLAEREYLRGYSDIYGMDLLIKKKWPRYDSWLALTLSKVRYEFSDVNQGIEFPADHDQPIQFNWMHSFKLGKKFDLSANIHISSGLPYTPASGIDTITQSNGQVELVPAYASRNQSRLPIYRRFDLSGNYHFKGKGGRMTGKTGIAIFNFFNRQNIRKIDYVVRAPGGGQPPELVQLPRSSLSFTPNIFVEFAW